MAKKKVKVFETGNYAQGDFPIEKVTEIFGKTNTVNGIFAHSDKLAEVGKEPKILGEVSNFQIEGETVYADVELNDKGEIALENEFIDGISVELFGGEVSQVAFLPTGTKPQISGANFSEDGSMKFGGLLTFEEVPKITMEFVPHITNLDMTIPEDVATFEAIQDEVWKLSDEKWAVKQLVKAGYSVMKSEEFATFEKKKEPTVAKTEVELRAEITREIEVKRDALVLFEQYRDEGKITKALEEKGLNLAFFEKMVSNKTDTDGVIRFEEKEFNLGVAFFELMDNIKGLKLETAITRARPKDTGERKGDILAAMESLNALKN